MKFINHLALCALMALAATSCGVPKDVALFQDIDEGVVGELAPQLDIKVQPEDKLSIIVNSKDPALAALFNLPVIAHRVGQVTGGATTSLNTTQYVSYYTVNKQGDIDFPVLGTIHIGGMRRYEVAAYIRDRLINDNLIKDPTVTVEFINTGISIMGEVNRPGRYDLNRDHLTILEALSMAGDIAIQGKRDNVMVLREVDGKQMAYRLDLTNAQQMYNSPGYYLQQNDIVYVEPNAVKKRQTTVNGNTALSASFWVSVASLLTSIAVLIFK